jgi:zinc transport system substrate-binding protein
MKSLIVKLMLTAAICMLLTSGCSIGSNPGDTSVKEQEIKNAKVLKVVTSFYPIYIETINVTGDVPGVSVINMTQPQTGCLHDYNLKTGDMKKVEDADIFVVNGAGMETFIEKLATMQPNLKLVVASKGLSLLKDKVTGKANAHIWVSVKGSSEQVSNIADQLGVLDPEHANMYRSNAEKYIYKLNNLDKEMHAELDDLKYKNIVTFHEAFDYFADEFNLKVKAVMELDPGSEPEARELAGIIDIVKQDNVKALFTEPQYASNIAMIVARETEAKVYELDPVVTGEANGDKDAYIRTMQKNTRTLKEALNGK